MTSVWRTFLLLIGACLATDRRPTMDALALKAGNATKSVLTQFFQEPELGQTWYSPYGPMPVFQSDQKNGTVYETRLGSSVLLDCQVTALEKDLVSWFRKAEGTLVLLTVGFQPYSSEDRFMLDFQTPHNYRLRIDDVQWRDEGVYQCQLATHPPQVSWSRLTLVRPVVHILDGEFQPVRDLHYDGGTTIELVCRVRRPPLHFVSLLWSVMYLRANESVVLNHDTSRGGILIETGRNESVLLSRLSVAVATVGDAGNYSCRLSDLPETGRHGLVDTVAVHILRDPENTEAIQSGGGHVTAGGRTFWMLLVMIAAVDTG